eukprot:GHVS01000459.1.p1 GENE.GHVS01000459.1~~GHVS01000459.1.p1  ORF type:complete len:149 (-),score=35.18 GHVS01000459.1:335-781(-)
MTDEPATPSPVDVAKTPSPLRKAVFTKVSQLDPNSLGVNLVVKVVSVTAKAAERKGKVPTPGDRTGEAVVGDASGAVTMSLRKEQLELCAEGRTVVIRNGVVKMAKQHMRLEVNKWGKMEPAQEEADFTVNIKNDMSGVEYELVSVTD